MSKNSRFSGSSGAGARLEDVDGAGQGRQRVAEFVYQREQVVVAPFALGGRGLYGYRPRSSRVGSYFRRVIFGLFGHSRVSSAPDLFVTLYYHKKKAPRQTRRL